MSENLLPCPFCGSAKIDPTGWTTSETAGPACDDCGASAGSTSKTVDENGTAWNTRTPLSSPDDGVVTDEMVERGARALCKQRGGDPDRLEPGDVPCIDGYRRNGDPAHFVWRHHADEARACLSAALKKGE